MSDHLVGKKFTIQGSRKGQTFFFKEHEEKGMILVAWGERDEHSLPYDIASVNRYIEERLWILDDNRYYPPLSIPVGWHGGKYFKVHDTGNIYRISGFSNDEMGMTLIVHKNHLDKNYEGDYYRMPIESVGSKIYGGDWELCDNPTEKQEELAEGPKMERIVI